ncbi:MAG: hypothetical protein AAFP90_02080, partial [Planctomycetota bacterium]
DLQINAVHHPFGYDSSLLWGVRASRQRDQYDVIANGTFAAGTPLALASDAITGRTENDLIGLQIGGTQTWLCGPIRFFGSIKAGVLHNETSQRGTTYAGAVDLSGNPATLAQFQVDDEEVSFVGDFELSLHYTLFRNASVRLGYQGLIYSDIIQVADQNGSPAAPGTLSYNGIFGGLELRY